MIILKSIPLLFHAEKKTGIDSVTSCPQSQCAMQTETHVHVPNDNLYKFVAIFSTVLLPTLLIAVFTVTGLFMEEYEPEELWKAVAHGEYRLELLPAPPPPFDADAPPPPPAAAPAEPEFTEEETGLKCFAWLVRTMGGAFVFLFMMSLLGFLLWYTRLQRFRDRIVKVEALTAETTYRMILMGEVVPTASGISKES